MPAETDGSIDIEEIILDIKKDIQARFTPEEILAFEPVDSRGSIVRVKMDSVFDEDYLDHMLVECASCSNVEWHKSFPGSRLSVFVKKVVRKLTACVIAPIVGDQNRYNNSVLEVLFQLAVRAEEQEHEITRLKARIADLEEELE